MLHRILIGSLFVSTLVGLANSQARTPTNRHQAPDALLTKLGIERGLVQDLSVPPNQVLGFDVTVTLGNKSYTLLLHAHDVRAPNFQLLVHDQNGLHVEPTPPNTTYRGVLLGLPGSIVAASLLSGQLHATIRIDGVVWAVQPVSPLDKTAAHTTHIAFSSRTNLPETLSCIEFKVPGQVKGFPAAGGRTTLNGGNGRTIYTCDIACDADNSFYVKNGSNFIATQNDVVRVINGVGTIFLADVDVDYRVSNVIIRKKVVYFVSGTTAVLGEFRTYWITNHKKVFRDLAHLFTDRRMGNVIGVAWLSVVCNPGYGYAVSVSRYSFNILRRYNLTAHELGHNWSCPHCSNPPTNCNIMCGNTGPCFSDVSKTLIRAHRDSRNCLKKAPRAPNLIAVRKPIRGEKMAWSYKAGSKDYWFLTLSLKNSYFTFLNFSWMDSSILLLNGQLDQWGLGGSSVAIPTSTMLGLRFYSQLVTVNDVTQAINGTSFIHGSTIN